MEYINCQVCGQDDYHVLLDKLHLCKSNNIDPTKRIILYYQAEAVNYRNVVCKHCGLVYLNPRMNESECEDFYRKQYRKIYTANLKQQKSSQYPFTPSHIGFEIYNAVVRLDFLEQHELLSNKTKSLDIGSSLGALPAYLQHKGIAAHGLEISPFAKYSQELFTDINIYQKSIETFHTNTVYDLITICDVFEHLAKPRYVLKQIRNLLADNGTLLLEIPDLYVPHKSLLTFYSNAHLYTYSANTIQQLLTETGFKVKIITHGGYCKNLRIIAEKNLHWDKHYPQHSYDYDDANKVLEFTARYNLAYEAWQKFAQGHCNFDQAQAIINSSLPQYNAAKFIQAANFFSQNNYAKSAHYFHACLEHDFNEEHISMQTGAIHTYLAACYWHLNNFTKYQWHLQQAITLMPKIFSFPYLDQLKTKNLFDLHQFMNEQQLPYQLLSELQLYLQQLNNQQNAQ